MQAAASHGTASGWVVTTLRWLWGADDDVGWRELFTATPATWCLLAIFSAVSVSDMVLAGSLHVSGPGDDIWIGRPLRRVDRESIGTVAPAPEGHRNELGAGPARTLTSRSDRPIVNSMRHR